MTLWMNPEFDKGWAMCLLWLQGGKRDEATTERKSFNVRAYLGTTGTPSLPFLKGGSGNQWAH